MAAVDNLVWLPPPKKISNQHNESGLSTSMGRDLRFNRDSQYNLCKGLQGCSKNNYYYTDNSPLPEMWNMTNGKHNDEAVFDINAKSWAITSRHSDLRIAIPIDIDSKGIL